MQRRSFVELVLDLSQRRTAGDRPPVLLLGAGASVDSGIGSMTDLFAYAGCANFDAFVAYIRQRAPDERYRLLHDFLQNRAPEKITPGYRALAKLCEEAYFDLVLTTNLDPLVDDALAEARLWRKDYLVLINGVMRQDRLQTLLKAPRPRVKVLKLHGDLFHRFMAWTPEEMEAWLTEIRTELHGAIENRDLLVVGHSLRDPRVLELAHKVIENQGVVWYTHPSEVPAALRSSPAVRAVLGPDCRFENLFGELLTGLEPLAHERPPSRVFPPPPATKWWGLGRHAGGGFDFEEVLLRTEPVAGAEPEVPSGTIDDLLASVVGVGVAEGRPASTGFVIRGEPRAVVCDRYSVERFRKNDRIAIVLPGGATHEVRILGAQTRSPFGPAWLEVPPDLRVAGLEIDTTQVAAGTHVHVAVAAGESPGISSGVVDTADERTIDVAPIGRVDRLTELRCVVAPGSSGAPVVDDAFCVRGLLVAGSSDPKNPSSFMYAAQHWLTEPKPEQARRVARPRRAKRID